MTHATIVNFLVAIGVLLAGARAANVFIRRMNLPPVTGEIIAGIVLGKTILGRLWPDAYERLFSQTSSVAPGLAAITLLGSVLLLFVAGLEIEFDTIRRQGKVVALTGLFSVLIPFLAGALLILVLPPEVTSSPNRAALTMFLGVALSISALPVIAKILLDLKLLHSDLGAIIMGAAMFNDFVGWIAFAIVLNLFSGKAVDLAMIARPAAMTLGIVVICLVVLRPLTDRLLLRLRRADPHDEGGNVLSIATVCAVIAGAFTEWMGAHAVFGAFLVGVSIGASKNLREDTRNVARRFVAHLLAPIFFASMTLRVDFVAAFEWRTTSLILLFACIGKITGAFVGAKLGRLSSREALAVGFGLNTRGAMEIILAGVAMQAGIINPPIFVALIIMAVLTSIMGGPAIARLLRHQRVQSLLPSLLRESLYVSSLVANDRDGAIAELARLAAVVTELSPTAIVGAVLEREELASTALGEGIAIPQARFPELDEAVLVVGRSSKGIDFQARDGLPVHLLFLILTPEHNRMLQLQVIAGIATAMSDQARREIALHCSSFSELRTALLMGGSAYNAGRKRSSLATNSGREMR